MKKNPFKIDLKHKVFLLSLPLKSFKQLRRLTVETLELWQTIYQGIVHSRNLVHHILLLKSDMFLVSHCKGST